MKTRIIYSEELDSYSVQINLPHMGWVTVQSYLSKEKAEQVDNWVKGECK